MKIKLKVKPNSSSNKIIKTNESEYIAYIKEPPKNNKANIKLINLLAKKFNTSVKNIKIINPSSRNKIVEILQ